MTDSVAPPQNLRPLRHSLTTETVELLASYRARTGRTPTPVHMMLVDDSGPTEVGRAACVWAGGPAYLVLGEYVTGASEQVTCRPCLEQMHA